MSAYEYPYQEFSRDIEAILPSPNAVSADYAQLLATIQRYVARTYLTRIDQLERGTALLEAMFYLGTNLVEFEDAGLAICGETQALVSKRALRAFHALVLGKEGDEFPPSEVIKLALHF